MKITIDQEKCIGCGSCAAICPESFDMDMNNKPFFKQSVTKNNKVFEPAEPSCYKEAIEACPVQAIKIEG